MTIICKWEKIGEYYFLSSPCRGIDSKGVKDTPNKYKDFARVENAMLEEIKKIYPSDCIHFIRSNW